MLLLIGGPLMTPMPWGGLWLLVPLAVTASLLAAWRWGAWGVLVPVALFGAAMVIEGPFSLWVWWIPVAALTGAWMGLREEGGGLGEGQRAWMLLPVLLLAAMLPWMTSYADMVTRLERALREFDQQALASYHEIGLNAAQIKAIADRLHETAAFEKWALPYAVPTVLFMWMLLLVALGRGLADRLGRRLRWPALARGELATWRLPDPAVWLLLLGLGLVVARWQAWGPSAWTLLLNMGLAYCVQGIAVAQSLLLARGVPPSFIALTFVFVFAMAWPAFVLATMCVGLSDVWLDYRRLEAVPDGDSSQE
ncbi:MAG: DUF2232 domain-containing protein [Candidatus Eisenbacteria bacterium]|uniref:DUF2232 domain-containing protein n=1 Tax=Eiseniibacteriota bacterium TaxID=2212470 RepID=A0A9D6L956_UNCEI|nr:DUF2232 domain-containing protein [Candidatus Eisenbacteria bacterium]